MSGGTKGHQPVVDIFIKSAKLAAVLNHEARLKRVYGSANAKQIRLRLAVLDAAACLADVPTLSPDRRRRLTGSRRGCFTVDAEPPFRIVLQPSNEPLPQRPDGKLDLRKVTEVTILEIVEHP